MTRINLKKWLQKATKNIFVSVMDNEPRMLSTIEEVLERLVYQTRHNSSGVIHPISLAKKNIIYIFNNSPHETL